MTERESFLLPSSKMMRTFTPRLALSRRVLASSLLVKLYMDISMLFCAVFSAVCRLFSAWACSYGIINSSLLAWLKAHRHKQSASIFLILNPLLGEKVWYNARILLKIGNFMKIVLLNTDPMVAKLIEATAKKTGLELEGYASVSELDASGLGKDCFVFVDESAVGEHGDVAKQLGKDFLSCFLYAKTKALDTYKYLVKKPFLPTQILDMLEDELRKIGRDLSNAASAPAKADIAKVDAESEDVDVGAASAVASASAGAGFGADSGAGLRAPIDSSALDNLGDFDIAQDFDADSPLPPLPEIDGLDMGADEKASVDSNASDSSVDGAGADPLGDLGAKLNDDALDSALSAGALDSGAGEGIDSDDDMADIISAEELEKKLSAESKIGASENDAGNIGAGEIGENEIDTSELDMGDFDTSKLGGGMADMIAEAQADEGAKGTKGDNGEADSASDAGDANNVDALGALDEASGLGDLNGLDNLGGLDDLDLSSDDALDLGALGESSEMGDAGDLGVSDDILADDMLPNDTEPKIELDDAKGEAQNIEAQNESQDIDMKSIDIASAEVQEPTDPLGFEHLAQDNHPLEDNINALGDLIGDLDDDVGRDEVEAAGADSGAESVEAEPIGAESSEVKSSEAKEGADEPCDPQVSAMLDSLQDKAHKLEKLEDPASEDKKSAADAESIEADSEAESSGLDSGVLDMGDIAEVKRLLGDDSASSKDSDGDLAGDDALLADIEGDLAPESKGAEAESKTDKTDSSADKAESSEADLIADELDFADIEPDDLAATDIEPDTKASASADDKDADSEGADSENKGGDIAESALADIASDLDDLEAESSAQEIAESKNIESKEAESKEAESTKGDASEDDFLALDEKEICEALGEEAPQDSEEAPQDLKETPQDLEKAPQDLQTPQEPESTSAGDESTEDDTATDDASKIDDISADIANIASSDENIDDLADLGADVDSSVDFGAESSEANENIDILQDIITDEPAQEAQEMGEVGEAQEVVGAQDMDADSASTQDAQDTQAKDAQTKDAQADEMSAENLPDDLGSFGAGLSSISDLRDDMQMMGDDNAAQNASKAPADSGDLGGIDSDLGAIDAGIADASAIDASSIDANHAARANEAQQRMISELLANKTPDEIRSLLNGAQISINISFSDK